MRLNRNVRPNMKAPALGICLLMLIPGCVVIDKTPDSPSFTKLSCLKDLEGTYQNRGMGGHPIHPVMLSKIIWADDDSMNHDLIHTIAVRAVDDNALEIEARNTHNQIVKRDCFIRSKHYRFDDGRIYLRSGWRTYLGPDDPVLGPKYEWIELGLDTDGDGKYRSGGGVVGLAYLFFPVIAVETDDAIFVRINE